jgi:hypothetical protein
MKEKISEKEVRKLLDELAGYGILLKGENGYKVSRKYVNAWKDALKEIAKDIPKQIKTTEDANISAHLKALWVYGYFDKAKSKDEIMKAILTIDTWRLSRS